MHWGHGLGFLAGLIWLAVVIYLLTLAVRLVRAIERIADKLESRAP
jgi:heme exporter protein D